MSAQQHSCWIALLFGLIRIVCSDSDRVQQIIADRHTFETQLAALLDQSSAEDRHQQGIIVPCGGAGQLANAYVSLRVIRNYFSCNLPVEIAYYGAHEMDDYHRSLFQAVNNTHLKDLSSVTNLEYRPDSLVGGYAAKAFAIIHSSFAEILCLDSDNIPLRDPSTLFAWNDYQQHGNVFWSDPNINGLDSTVYEMFSLQPPWAADSSFHACESGQILLNRQKHVDVLHWLWFVTANSDYFYPKMHGDKDTYRLAFMLANKAGQYNQIRAGPQLGLAPWKRPEGLFYISAGFVQPDFDQTPVFYHRLEQGAKFNPQTPMVLTPSYVTTTLSHSWRRPDGTAWFNVGFQDGGWATHYPASGVNTSAYQQCCPSLASKSTHRSCSCQPTSAENDNMMLAIPLAYFPQLARLISVSHNIFTAYQHRLWRHDMAAQLSNS